MSLTKLTFVTFLMFFSLHLLSQRNFSEYNMLGLQGGVTWFDINTTNFNTQQGSGFLAGFSSRGDVYNNFDLEYGISFFQHTVGILGAGTVGNSGISQQYLDYTLSGVQIKLLPGYNIIRHHLSIDAGPILNINGKMNLDSENLENFILDGYETLSARAIEDVSRVHLHLAAGITGGLRNFRVNVQYQYGATNLFARFNDAELLAAEKPQGGFRGNTSTIVAGIYFYF